jgi:DNA-directed RNA polymerase alpha subunit
MRKVFVGKNTMRKDLQKRDEEIYKLREQGKTYKYIASLYSIGSKRAWQIYHREKEKYDNAYKWPPLKKRLSTRTQNCLVKYFGYYGHKDILNNPKKIAELGMRELFKIKNLGIKSVTELILALHGLGYIKSKDLLKKIDDLPPSRQIYLQKAIDAYFKTLQK